MLRRLAVPLAAALALSAAGGALAAPTGTRTSSQDADVAVAAAPAAATARAATLEIGIVRELNRVRIEHGLAPLGVSSGLATAAAGHSAAMVRSGLFDHTSADGTSFAKRVVRSYPVKGFASWTVGENLLFDSGDIDARGAVQAWMDSPPHRANMLNPSFREVGVGALKAEMAGGDFGGGPALVITLDFGARTPAAMPARRARPAAQRIAVIAARS